MLSPAIRGGTTFLGARRARCTLADGDAVRIAETAKAREADEQHEAERCGKNARGPEAPGWIQ